MSGQGFASFGKDKRAAVSGKGGKTAHQMGKAHKFSTIKAKAASAKGLAGRKRKYALIAAQRLLKAGFTPAQLDSLKLSIEEYLYYGGSGTTKGRVRELIDRVNSSSSL